MGLSQSGVNLVECCLSVGRFQSWQRAGATPWLPSTVGSASHLRSEGLRGERVAHGGVRQLARVRVSLYGPGSTATLQGGDSVPAPLPGPFKLTQSCWKQRRQSDYFCSLVVVCRTSEWKEVA